MPEFQAWVAYFRAVEGFQDYRKVGAVLKDISVFALQFDEEGRLIPANDSVRELLPKLKTERPGARLWLTAVNDVRAAGQNMLKDPEIVHETLAVPEKLSRHIQELLTWSRDVDGIDIDYEGLKLEDTEAFSRFIKELAAALHSQGKCLSVTVEPKVSRVPGDGARTIDWKRCAAAADQIRVMAYFYYSPRGNPGPIAPLAWLSDLARFARREVPPKKLTVVLTVNGLDWSVPGTARGIRFDEVSKIAAEHGVQVARDHSSEAPHFLYSINGEQHEVWYEDSASLRAKIEQLRGDGIRSVGFWQLGSGDPDFWQWLSSVKPTERRNSSESVLPGPPSRHSLSHS
jgi:spore germination protein YaaH